MDTIPLISFENIYFIEINVMPTIRENNNFVFSFNAIDEHNIFFNSKKAQKNFFGNITLNSFLLANSMISFVNN